MPLVTRAVFGFVYRTDGTALAAVPITIRAYPNVFQPDGSVAPASLLTPITNSAGRYDVVLVVNARYLIGIPGDVFEIIVPSGAGSVSVESLRATTTALMTNAVQLAFDAAVAAHATLTTAAHGGLVAANDGRLTNARTPTGSAGGVLSGTYPSPGFAADMATQTELDAALLLKENALGNPDTDGKILSGTVAGARSWITPPAGGGGAEALEALRYINTTGNPAFANAWINFGSGWGTAAFYKDRGRVYLQGLIYSPTAVNGETIFLLPVGYRPVDQTFREFGPHRIDLFTDGRVVWGAANGAPTVELWSVQFRAA